MKQYIFILSLLFVACFSNGQKLDSTALILIDIQDFYFPGGKVELAEPEKAAIKAGKLLQYFRENDGLIVHVRHNFQPGGDINELVKPVYGEKIISKNEVNAFLKTDLNEFLKKNHIKSIVLVGMQTHMCLEAGTRAGHDLGYNCTVVGDACATRNLKMDNETILAKDVQNSTLATLKSYAQVTTLEEYIK